MISKKVSMDIVTYLQKEKKLSVEDISKLMESEVDHINKVVEGKSQLLGKEVNSYLKSSKISFWEFAINAIPMNHLSEKARDRVLLCKQISDHIKKKKF